jgi:hypothetical protein
MYELRVKGENRRHICTSGVSLKAALEQLARDDPGAKVVVRQVSML